MKKIYVTLIGILAVFGLTGCGNNGDELGLVEKGTLTVVTSSDYAPYEFIDTTKTGQDAFVGSDISMAKYFAEKLGLKLKIKSMKFDVCLTALDSGKGDLFIAGLTWKDDRAAQYAYTDYYTMNGEGAQLLLIRKEDASKYSTMESLNNSSVKIGVQAASVQADLVDTNLPNATKVINSDINTLVTSLESGQIDAVAIAEKPATLQASSHTSLQKTSFSFPLGEDKMDYLYACAPKTNLVLVEKINEIIKEIVTKGLYDVWYNEAVALKESLDENAGEFIPEDESSN